LRADNPSILASVTALSVIVPARNCAAHLERCLAALAAQDLAEPYEVIVVDNGSTDGTAEVAERHGAPVRVIRQENRGPAEARNRGAAAAAGAVLAFTDADCLPAPGWLSAGLACLDSADLVQGRVAAEPGVPIGPFDRSLWVPEDRGNYQTANLFVKKAWFEEVGGFEAWFDASGDRPFGEDVLFGWRVRRAGGTARFCQDALVHHAVLPGTAGVKLREAARQGLFADLIRVVPEARGFLFMRIFLSRRRAAFDLALAGAIAALILWSAWPLLAVAPYVWLAVRDALRYRGRAPQALAVSVAADAVGLASLLTRSAATLRPVL
jgi:glycosyltransferase involved in cell wall biosynthesis